MEYLKRYAKMILVGVVFSVCGGLYGAARPDGDAKRLEDFVAPLQPAAEALGKKIMANEELVHLVQITALFSFDRDCVNELCKEVEISEVAPDANLMDICKKFMYANDRFYSRELNKLGATDIAWPDVPVDFADKVAVQGYITAVVNFVSLYQTDPKKMCDSMRPLQKRQMGIIIGILQHLKGHQLQTIRLSLPSGDGFIQFAGALIDDKMIARIESVINNDELMVVFYEQQGPMNQLLGQMAELYKSQAFLDTFKDLHIK